VSGIETMLTNRNWFHTNLRQRFVDKSADLKFIINPYRFKSISFDEATDFTCQQLGDLNKKIFVAFSGGYDSEYVVRSLHKNSINFVPIIVKCGHTHELEYAYETCEELRLEPIILEISEKYFLDFFEEHIINKFDSVGYNSVYNMVAADYVSKIDNSVLISGNHFLTGDGIDFIQDAEIFLGYDWDFYVDYFLEKPININFFTYNIEMVYSVIPDSQSTGMIWAIFKHKKFNLKLRNKMRYRYSDETENRIQELLKIIKYPNKKIKVALSRKQFFDFFEKYKEI
jgi:hypothetical protein